MLHSPSEASAKALPRVSIKSPELNASLTSLIQDMVNLNGKRSSGIETSLILCGHTHIPRVVRLRDGRMIVNPGSVGLPGYDGQAPVSYVVEVGTPHACYAILERTRGGWSATIRYVPYDNAD